MNGRKDLRNIGKRVCLPESISPVLEYDILVNRVFGLLSLNSAKALPKLGSRDMIP